MPKKNGPLIDPERPPKPGPLIQNLTEDGRARALADPPPKDEAERPDKPKGKGEALPTLDDLKQFTREWSVRELLAAPFHPDELERRPDGTWAVRPAAVAQRLDEVLGPVGWGLRLHPDALCGRLAVAVGERATTRDATGDGDGPVLVACAELFGVGRYLRKVPPGPLPDWALPRAPDKDRKPWAPKAEAPKAEAPKVEAASTPKAEAPRPKGATNEGEWVDEWRGKFASADTPEEFNAMLPGLKQVPQPFKQAVWDAISEEAREYGWRYDAAAKRFFLPESEAEGEAIPF